MGALAAALVAGGSDVAGGILNANATAEANANNISEENFLASNGIQLKVEDARKAGINPIYALGGSASSGPSETVMPDLGVGEGVSKAGQDISRAINSTASAPDRDYVNKMNNLNVEGKKLDNDIKRSQLGNMPGNQPQNPPMPSDHAMGQWSGVSNAQVAAYPKGRPHDADSIYNYYNVPGATQGSSRDFFSDLGVSASDVSRGLRDWLHLAHMGSVYGK